MREPFLALVFALDALILGFRPRIFVHSDTWLALVGGRLVWTSGLPHRDTLTVWANGKTWVDQQWLGQLAFYGVHAAGGLRLVLLVHVALLLTAFGLALAFARRSGGSARSVALIGIAGLFVALPNSTVRTQSFGYVFFVALFWLLACDARRRSRRVFWALPLLALWANVHGSVVLGVGLVFLWALAALAGAGRRTDGESWRERGRAGGLAFAAVLCLFASPYGLGVAGYYADVLGSRAFRDVVTEWGPTTLPAQLPFVLLGLASLWLAARKAGRLSLFEHLALLVTLLAGFAAIRNIVWLAFVAIMVVPRALDGVWPPHDAPVRERANRALALGSLVLVLGALVVAASHGGSWYERGFPPAAAAAAAGDGSARVFANETFADWLLWERPRLAGRVAFDARFELLSTRQLRELAHFRHRSSADWRAAARGYPILVLDPRTERATIRRLLREPGATRLYRDDDVAVIARRARS